MHIPTFTPRALLIAALLYLAIGVLVAMAWVVLELFAIAPKRRRGIYPRMSGLELLGGLLFIVVAWLWFVLLVTKIMFRPRVGAGS